MSSHYRMDMEASHLSPTLTESHLMPNIMRDSMTMLPPMIDSDEHDESEGCSSLKAEPGAEDMGGKGSAGRKGRRKQSQPIRIYLDDEVGMPGAAVAAAGQAMGHEGASVNAEGAQRTMDVDQATVQCEFCRQSFTSQNQLRDHMQRLHNVDPESMDTSFPTKYHQLGSQLQESAMHSLPSDMEEQSPYGENNPPHDGPTPPLDPDNSEAGIRPRSNRIFHLDAYCDLCDREFCNKYFLKTHKANKHGIFENGNSPPHPENGFNPFMLPPPTLNGDSDIQSRESSPPQQQRQSPMLLPPQLTPVSSAPSSLAPPPPLLTKASDDTQSTSSSPTASTPAPKPGAADMEDYCEICQKHFCNKYYLKKHKQDVHGIIPENPPQKRPRTNSSMRSLSGLPSLDSGSNSSLSHLGLPHLPPGLTPQQAANMANVMFINPFAPPILIQGQPVLQQLHAAQQAGFLPPGMGPLPQGPPPPLRPPSSTSDTPPKTSTAPPTSSSPQSEKSQSSAAEPPRSSSGPPPPPGEAFCELCRKEFCNNYFLRVHKANKHGIFLPEDLSDLSPHPTPSGVSSMSPKSNCSDSRNETGSQSGRNSGTVTPSGEDGSRKSENSDKPEDVSCKICGKGFTSKFSLRIHLVNVHDVVTDLPGMAPGQPDPAALMAASMGLSVSNEREPGEKVPTRPSAPPLEHFKPLPPPGIPTSEANISSTIFGNMIAAKLADRVVCDICNKEVCNKYFLKTHKLKVHGIIPDQQDNRESIRDPNREPIRERSSSSLGNNSGSTPIEPPKKDTEHSNMMTSVGLNLSTSSGPTDLSTKSRPIEPEMPEKRPPDEELLKMGIDPEAYCEICKKEFCSKYFLKTHKLNIHGIKVENTIETPKKRGHSPPYFSSAGTTPTSQLSPSMSMPFMHLPFMAHPGLHPPPPLPPPPPPGQSLSPHQQMPPHSMSHHHPSISSHQPIHQSMPPHQSQHHQSSSSHHQSMPHHHQSMPSHHVSTPSHHPSMAPHHQSMAPHHQSMPPRQQSMPSMPPHMLSAAAESENERRSWKWKEPINATRVMCEFCNKELCNKYFLKTHMLNKHGVLYDHITGATSPAPGRKLNLTGSDNSNSPTHHSASSMSLGKENKPSNMNSNSQSPVFNLSGNKSRNPELLVDKGQPMVRALIKEFETRESHQQQFSELCKSIGMSDEFNRNMIMARTWQVPPPGYDVRREADREDRHKDSPKIKQEPMVNGQEENDKYRENQEPYIHTCNICGLLFGESITLQIHKVRDHGISLEPPQKVKPDLGLKPPQDSRTQTPAESPRPSLTYSPVTNIGLALRRKYQRSVKHKFRGRRWRRLGQTTGGGIGEKTKSAIVNHIQNHQHRKKFRCAHCSERFLSKPLCQAHIRAEHPNARAFDSNNSSDMDEHSRSKLLEHQQRSKHSAQSNQSSESQPSGPEAENNNERSKSNRNNCGGQNGDAIKKAMKGGDNEEMPVSYAKEVPALMTHTGSYIMQSFTIQEKSEDGCIAPSVVYLPVFSKISQPMTVTMTLTPNTEH